MDADVLKTIILFGSLFLTAVAICTAMDLLFSKGEEKGRLVDDARAILKNRHKKLWSRLAHTKAEAHRYADMGYACVNHRWSELALRDRRQAEYLLAQIKYIEGLLGNLRNFSMDELKDIISDYES
jgi:hypothetical protein